MSKSALTVQNLCKRYGEKEVLKGVSLTLKEGEIAALLGPNGAGKTTALECIEGLRTRDSGRVEICIFILMRVIHELPHSVHLLIIREDSNLASSDYTLIRHRAVAFVFEILKLMLAVHLEGSTIILLEQPNLVSLERTVKIQRQLTVMHLRPEVERKYVRISVIV